jgi:hypothetical protein
MPFVSVTRLRLRSILVLPAFVPHTTRSLRQVRGAPGFRGGSLLQDRAWAFWTLTAWDDEAAMRSYMTSGDHRTAMPRLAGWCDEASVVHWWQAAEALPDWGEADRRMRGEGRPSRLRRPSPDHAALTYRAPRLSRAASIRPAPSRAAP